MLEEQDLLQRVQYKPVDIHPDHRTLRRISVRENEGVTAFVSILGESEKWPCNVVDISSMGLCIESNFDQQCAFKQGDAVEIDLACREDRYSFPCSVCHVSDLANGGQRLGLMRVAREEPPSVDPYPIHKIALTATTYHTYFYNENVVLRIVGFAKDHCTIECDDPEFMVFEEMRLSLLLHISFERRSEIQGRVEWIEILDKGKMRFGFHIDHFSDKTKEAIVRYLFQLHDWKPRELREMGFEFKGYRPLVKFRSLRTHEEYLQVLRLRRLAYLSAKKIDSSFTDMDLASDLDRKSRIVLAYHQSKLVGSVTILFPDREDMVLDTERTFPGGYPIKMPLKTEMIEIARLCITPDYRATDILWGLFEQIYRILITSKRSYVLTSTDDHMWTLYRKVGFQKIGLTYDHPVLSGIKHDIILVHKNSPLYGKNVSPLVWGHLFWNMTDFLIASGAVRLNAYQKARVIVNKSLYSVVKIFKRK